MPHYSVQPRRRIFVKRYGFLSFAKNMGKNIGKNIKKTFSSKYTQKVLDHSKKSAKNSLETTSKRNNLETVEATGNKITNRITKVSKTSPKIIQIQMKKKYSEKDLYLQN